MHLHMWAKQEDGNNCSAKLLPPGQSWWDFPSGSALAAMSECCSWLSLTSLSLQCKPGLCLWLWVPQLCVSHPQVFKQPWPGIMRTLYGKHQQFETVYFQKFPGYYVTGDGKGLQAAGGLGTAVQILPCAACRIPYQLL